MNRLDEPVFMAVSKLLLTEFGIHRRLKSCVGTLFLSYWWTTIDCYLTLRIKFFVAMNIVKGVAT